MTEATLQHIDEDLEALRRDVALIKNILCEEGKPTAWARRAIAEARAAPRSAYVTQEELERRIRSRKK